MVGFFDQEKYVFDKTAANINSYVTIVTSFDRHFCCGVHASETFILRAEIVWSDH